MNMKKLLALLLSVLMLVFMLASCGGNGGKDNVTTPAQSDTEKTVKVSMKVKDLSGKVVYDIPEYTYSGDQPYPLYILEDYFYMEEGDEDAVQYEEVAGTVRIISIGTINAEELVETNAEGNAVGSVYWWWRLNGKDVENQGLDDYEVKNGDVIEFYLIKK